MTNQKLANGQFLKITELYAFVAKDKNGHEGIMGFQHKGQWMPMIGADLDRVEALVPLAEEICKQFKTTYELRYFTMHGDVTPSLYKKT